MKVQSVADQKVVALIVAAGRGVRAGGEIPKQYREIGGRPVLRWTLDRFLEHPLVAAVAIVIGREDRDRYDSVAPIHAKLLPPIEGGSTRQESVMLGLEGIAGLTPFAVLIHDAVRPFVPAAVIGDV